MRIVFVCVASLLVLSGCGADEPPIPTDSLPTPPQKTLAGMAWLDRLEVDPVALVSRGQKGKKKLGEALGAYYYLLRYSPDPDARSRIRRRIEELAAHTSGPEYHDMLVCGDREFNENSMSYLRVAWLLEELDLDTSHYRAQLEAVRPRLEATLSLRKPAARAQFAWYYGYFGWPKPDILLETSRDDSLVASRVPVSRYRRPMVYQLTHEVSIAYRFGLRGSSDRFDSADRAYLRRVLPALTIRFSQMGGATEDLVAELVSAMTYLGFDDLPAYRTGIHFLLQSQNADGSWGDYEARGDRLGEDLDVVLYLHTTTVALRALLESNDRAWARSFGEPRETPR